MRGESSVAKQLRACKLNGQAGVGAPFQKLRVGTQGQRVEAGVAREAAVQVLRELVACGCTLSLGIMLFLGASGGSVPASGECEVGVSQPGVSEHYATLHA